jgi:hypothetical protein
MLAPSGGVLGVAVKGKLLFPSVIAARREGSYNRRPLATVGIAPLSSRVVRVGKLP